MSRPLEDVQDEILDRIHAGESVDREALLEEHPEHREALGAFFEVLDIVEGDGEGLGPAVVRLGEFRIIRELGRGGMGRVYEAEQTSLKRRVALKVLPPTLRLDGRLVSRFRREAEAAGRLRHPGIVPVFSVGEAAGTPFFAMELVEGVSLQQVIAGRRAGEDAGLPSDPEAWRRWAVETAAKVADALAYAHAHGILHRDVKPGNILLGESGEPRLTDFGLALDLRAPELTQTGEVFGSPQYMSPEQALRRKAPVDERTDVYSLAVTLYELLTMRLPYDGTTSAEFLSALVSGKVVPPRKVDPSIPRSLEHVLMGALSRDPRNRYRYAAELAHDLRATLEGADPAYQPPVPLKRRLRIPLAVAGAALLVALGLALWLSGGRQGDGGQSLQHPPAPVESVDDVMAEYVALGPSKTHPDFVAAIKRLRAIDTEASRTALRRVYEDYVAGPGANDPEARAFLGFREFSHEIPEAIAFRDYPYLKAVERASAKRWFAPGGQEDYLLATRAWELTREHARRLAEDRYFRTADQVRANIGMDPTLGKYHVTTRWADPYLICYLAAESASEFDLLTLPTGKARDARAAELEARRDEADRALDEAASVFTKLSAAYTSRFAEAAGLKPLMEPWGGRPGLPMGVRSYPDGAPVVVLVFEEEEPWRGYIRTLFKLTGRVDLPLPPGVSRLFSPQTSYLYIFLGDPESANHEWEQLALLHDGVHQLQFWYRRQRNQWRMPQFRQDWYEDGLAGYLAGVCLAGGSEKGGGAVNALRLHEMQRACRALKARGVEYPIIPLDSLVGFNSFKELMGWAVQNAHVPAGTGMDLFYVQSWALTYFLNHAEGGRYREGYKRLFDLELAADGPDRDGKAIFESAFGLDSAASWAALDKAFQTYVRDVLMEMDTSR